MSLLRKAKKVRKAIETATQSGEEYVFDPNTGISEEDQKEILSQIEEIASKNRLTVSPDILAVKAPKQGYVFPFLVNLGAILILSVGFLILSAFFKQNESELRGETVALKTAEGKLIEEIKKETEAQLRLKEQEIHSIQSRLLEIDKEKNDLMVNMNSKIKQREEELRKAMEKELEEERRRLTSQGLSSADIDARLRQLEQEKTSQYNAQVEAYRRQAEAERAKMEADLLKLQADFQRNLASLSAERERILEESRKREASLQSQLEERTRVLELEKSRSQTELSKTKTELNTLREQRDRAQLIEEQIKGFYSGIRSAIGEGNFNKAKELVGNLQTYLHEDSLQNIPSIQQRKETDLLTAEALSILIDSALRQQQGEISQVLRTGTLVEEIQTLVGQAQQAFGAGNIQAAEQAYMAALSKVPEVLTAHQHFLNKKKEEETARKRAVEEALTEAEDAFRQGNYRTAITAYTKVFTFLPLEPAKAEQLSQNIQKSGYEVLLAEQKRVESRDAAGLLTEGNRAYTSGNYQQAAASYLTLLQKYPLSTQAPQAIEGIRKSIESQTAQFSARIAAIETNLTNLQTSRIEVETLRSQQAQEKAALEQAYKSRIATLEQELAELQRQNALLTAGTPREVIPIATPEKLKRLEAVEEEYNRVKACLQGVCRKRRLLVTKEGRICTSRNKALLRFIFIFGASTKSLSQF
jgi:Skp family chaperone for outer membrane proteins